MRKVVLRALRTIGGCDVTFYSTEAKQDKWSEDFTGNYTTKIENAIVFSSLTRAFEYVRSLVNCADMLSVEPMWLEEVKTVTTLVAKEIK